MCVILVRQVRVTVTIPATLKSATKFKIQEWAPDLDGMPLSKRVAVPAIALRGIWGCDLT
jgi:hypothetical protein